MAKLIRSIIIVFSIFCFNISSYSQSLDSIKIERFKKHVSSLDYITRQVDNSKYFLTLTSQYCDSILAIDSNNLFALYFQNRVNLTLSTCDQNMNHKIELFPFFNGFPAYMGFADDPIEYAYDMALEKLLESKYIKVQNGPIANTNISSIVIRDNCDDEMFEIINQILYKNTNHYIIPYNELVSILGHNNARALTDGKLDESSVALLCDKLGLDRLGIFRANDLDVINESIWLVESEFFTYHPEVGFTEPIFTRGFNQDKRGISFIYIFLFGNRNNTIYIESKTGTKFLVHKDNLQKEKAILLGDIVKELYILKNYLVTNIDKYPEYTKYIKQKNLMILF